MIMFFFQLFLVDDVNATLDPDKLWVKAWFPIMFELSTIISRCKLDVRTRSVIQKGVAIFESVPRGASRVFLGVQGFQVCRKIKLCLSVFVLFILSLSFPPED